MFYIYFNLKYLKVFVERHPENPEKLDFFSILLHYFIYFKLNYNISWKSNK